MSKLTKAEIATIRGNLHAACKRLLADHEEVVKTLAKREEDAKAKAKEKPLRKSPAMPTPKVPKMKATPAIKPAAGTATPAAPAAPAPMGKGLDFLHRLLGKPAKPTIKVGPTLSADAQAAHAFDKEMGSARSLVGGGRSAEASLFGRGAENSAPKTISMGSQKRGAAIARKAEGEHQAPKPHTEAGPGPKVDDAHGLSQAGKLHAEHPMFKGESCALCKGMEHAGPCGK